MSTVISNLLPGEIFQTMAQKVGPWSELTDLSELRRQTDESKEVKTAKVHRTEYQRRELNNETIPETCRWSSPGT